jgi:SAM-dependent methyltransferase
VTGFASAWLDRREPVDRRSRSDALVQALANHAAGRALWRVVDLGCGTGANLRATAARLAADQHWTLLDHDPALIAVARDRLAAWADRAEPEEGGLALRKGSRRISVRFRNVDLAADLDAALGDGVDLLTASAFFDLVSPTFIDACAHAAAERGAAFYAVLTYDGRQRLAPEDAADAAILAAFNAHQANDKGFGPAAGPAAAQCLRAAFAARGYRVCEADSPWRLDAGDAALIGELVAGIAEAARATGSPAASTIAAWAGLRRTAAFVGHTDTLALPES